MSPSFNSLLEGFSSGLQQSLAAICRPVELPGGTVLYAPGEPIPAIYFLSSGLASAVVSVQNGGTAEVAVTGVDGAVGVSGLVGMLPPVAHCSMQMSGHGLRLSMADGRRIFSDSAEFRDRMLACLQVEELETMQVAACNKLHQAPERLARWLLTAADRTQSETLTVTQESISHLLGTRRTTVALVAGEMQRKGLLRYSRGRIHIADRAALTAAACDCYQSTRRLVPARDQV